MHTMLCALLLLFVTQTQDQPPQTPVTAPTSAPATTQPSTPNSAAPASTPHSGDYWIRLTANTVNIRDEPNTNTSLIIRQLNNGTVLRARHEEGGWHAIHAVPGTVCLVSKEYVTRSAAGTDGVVSVSSSPLMVRSESAITTSADPLKNKVIARLPNGAAVRILGEREGWYEIAPPAGVSYYVSADYAERITDDEAAKATPQIGETSPAVPVTSIDAQAPTSAPATLEGGLPPMATTRPAGGSNSAGLNGPWADRYRVVEAAVQTEMAKPELERGIESMILLLRPIADQREEREVATLAERRIAQLQPELEKQTAAKQMAAEAARHQREVQASQPAEEGPPPREPDRPTTPSDLDYRGILRPTFRVPVSSNGLRYALLDPIDKEVRCYIEIPWDLKIDLKTATGRFVGVRGERLFEGDYGAPLLRVSYMVILTKEKPTPAPRQ